MEKCKIHGARGSVPVSGRQFLEYGGATTCVSLETAGGMLVIDAGSGIINLSNDLARRRQYPPITLLFTHFHHDHLVGLPFFAPLYDKSSDITLMGANLDRSGNDWKKALTTIVNPPYWPVPFRKLPSKIKFRNIPKHGKEFEVCGVKIKSCPVRHPQGCLAFRLETARRSIILATDREGGDPELDKAFLAFCKDTDYLVHDAQYTPKEYSRRAGWGHSTWREAAAIAEQAGVKTLILTHHDPFRTDKQVDGIIRSTQKIFPTVKGATEKMTI